MLPSTIKPFGNWTTLYRKPMGSPLDRFTSLDLVEGLWHIKDDALVLWIGRSAKKIHEIHKKKVFTTPLQFIVDLYSSLLKVVDWELTLRSGARRRWTCWPRRGKVFVILGSRTKSKSSVLLTSWSSPTGRFRDRDAQDFNLSLLHVCYSCTLACILELGVYLFHINLKIHKKNKIPGRVSLKAATK